jgi:hypothetical protein
MAINSSETYGRDVRCWADADSQWTTVTGIDKIRQAVFHRVTTDSVMGPGGDEGFIDVRRFLGMRAELVPAYGPIIEDAVTNVTGIASATVTIVVTKASGGSLADASVTIDATTALGPFTLVVESIADLTETLISGQGK